MESRRFILALSLSVLVLVAWQAMFGPKPAPELMEPPATSEQAGETDAESPPPPTPAAAVPAPEVTQAAEALPLGIEPAERIAAGAEETVRVTTRIAEAVFTNRGAQLVSYGLLEHESNTGGAVDLVRARSGGLYPFGLRDTAGHPAALNGALWAVERERRRDGGEQVVFRYSGPEGRGRKLFGFRPDGMIDVEIEVAGGGEIVLGPGLRNPTLDETKSRFARRSAVYRAGEDIERVDPLRAKETVLVGGDGVAWVGLQDSYFLTALVLTEPVAQIALEPVLAEPDGDSAATFIPKPAELSDEQKDWERELQVAVRMNGERLVGVGFYGAKDYSRLKSLPYGLEESINLGVFGVLARPLLLGLRWIHNHVVGNYGWAIILMTLLIRTVLFPLNHKSVVSMQKMQKLNPQMQAIRQKYRSKLKDKQGRPNAEAQRKMNEEIMALYKKEGVNPASGCLPMLLQLPVLFAFYSLLSTAIEIRHAPWILWITDLSAKDPYYVLPIIMGASQLVQQRMTPAAGDPAQRRIFALMPVFFTILFLGFPSGLVLYWLTNNLLGIAQQAAYKKSRERKEAESASSNRTKKG